VVTIRTRTGVHSGRSVETIVRRWYGRTAEIFEAITGVTLTVPEAVAFMLSVKLSRIGNALEQGFTADMVRDSIVDLAGYADCLYAVWADATDEAMDDSLAEFFDELEDE
jgi:hypothetical protein